MIYPAKWATLKIIILSEHSQKNKYMLHDFFHMKLLEHANSSDRKETIGCMRTMECESWEEGFTKGNRKTFESNGYVYYLDCHGCFKGSIQNIKIYLFVYCEIFCHLSLNKNILWNWPTIYTVYKLCCYIAWCLSTRLNDHLLNFLLALLCCFLELRHLYYCTDLIISYHST